MQLLGPIYFMTAGFGIILGAVYLLIWLRIRDQPAFLFASVMSLAGSAATLCEVSYLGKPSTEDFVNALRAQSAFIGVSLIAMVWFLQFRLQVGRRWLGWFITGLWSISIVIILTNPGQIVTGWLDGLDYRTTPWNEAFALPVGEMHWSKYLTDLASLAIVIYVIDVLLRAFRTGSGAHALRTAGPVLFFIVVAGIHTPLVDASVIQTPYLIGVIFVAIAVSLAFSLVSDIARGAWLNREIQIERERWQSVVDAVDLALVRVDADGKIASVNPFLEGLIGRSSADLGGQKADTLFMETGLNSDPVPITDPEFWNSQEAAARFLPAADGTHKEMAWHCVALSKEAGTSDGLIAIGKDQTERLKAEAERDETRREFEKLSRALTLGELASTIAHELSQPIAAVLSNAQTCEILLESGSAGRGDIEEIIQDILRDTRRARDLMGHVRSFMYDGDPERQWFDPVTALRAVLEWLQPEAQRRRIAIRQITENPPRSFFGVELELQEAMINLIMNAMQATGDTEGGEIIVTIGGEADGGLNLSVEDNGPGISDEAADKLFAPFVTSKSKGMGVGLAVVRRVVERHNGRIDVGARAGGGARFVITLPPVQQTELRISA
ncbi:PAS domain S-box protein [Seohaeicola saemankumensis]|nr:ATP-binding protein [Seohaeicola saemankumensis]MCA0871447.1 PAS domain S-box protein [Seohaeicola saemankumensis]